MANTFDRGAQFTEERYLSKDEVQARYNLEDVDSIWSDIQSYRSLFRVDLPARSASGLSYYAVTTRTLLVRLCSIEGRLYRALLNTERSDYSGVQGLRRSIMADQMESIADHYELDLSRPEIERIALGEGSSNLNAGILTSMRRLEEELIGESDREFGPDLSDYINASLQGAEADEVRALPSRIDPLFRILSTENLPLVLRFLLVFFWFDLARPYEYSSELTSSFLAREFLVQNGFELLPYMMRLEPLYLNRSMALSRSIDLSIKTRDVTYYIRDALPCFEEIVEQLEADISGLVRRTRPERVSVSGGTEERPKSNRGPKPQPDLGEDPRSRKIREYLETYPVLKAFQVDFYLDHCTVGKFYTLRQFVEAEGVVYETARTSMDLLANLGFYRKGKTGKKFTFTPIPRGNSIQDIEEESEKENPDIDEEDAAEEGAEPKGF